MERKYKITIPEPCHENWNEMTPRDNGRFCLSCTKTVIDFTKMLPDEIQHFFIRNQNENVCGRFQNNQLEKISIQIPSQVLCTQTKYNKMFLLALFIAMGTTLFSCSDKDGNKNKIDKIEIVDNSTQNEDENETVSSCYGHQIEAKKEKPKKQLDYITMGAVIAPDYDQRGTFEYHTIYNSKDLDVLPVPINGMEKFHNFFNKNYTAPEETNKEEITVLFVVEKDSTLSNFTMLKNNSTKNADEIIRVLKTSPKWVPGKLKKRIVRSTYIFTFPFK